MPEMHLKHPGFNYSACGPFSKNKERMQIFKETGDPKYIYRIELHIACFQHDMAYGDFNDSPMFRWNRYVIDVACRKCKCLKSRESCKC